MKSDNLKHNNCLICNNQSLKALKGYEKDYLVKCNNCGFVFSEKIPTKQEISNVYDGYGRNDYLSPITIKRYNELLDKFEKYRKTNNILDIGCGIGYFLEQAKKRGWNVYGTEYSDKSVAICREKGINIFKGSITDSDYSPEMFDVLTSFEVIEHINNPLQEIPIYKKILRKGGLFYLTTPNFNSLERYFLKEKYNAIAYPEHLSYYTPKTIKYLFTNNNFDKIKIETTGISLSRIKMSKGVSSEQAISPNSSDEKMREAMEESKLLSLVKLIVNKLLTVFGVGNSLKASFVNKINK